MIVRPRAWQIIAFGGKRRHIGERDAVDPFERQHFALRPVPIDDGHAKIPFFLRVLGEFGGRRGLQAKIHFDLHRARQRIDDFDRLQPPRFRKPEFGDARGEIHVREIAAEEALDAGAENFDGDFALALVIADARFMNLRDRGRGDRLAELDEHLVDAPIERRFDRFDRLFARKRRHAVLQALEAQRDFRPHDIGTRREKLAEFDIRWAELLRLRRAANP